MNCIKKNSINSLQFLYYRDTIGKMCTFSGILSAEVIQLSRESEDFALGNQIRYPNPNQSDFLVSA